MDADTKVHSDLEDKDSSSRVPAEHSKDYYILRT